MSENKKIVLITGANKGIGFETARQLGKQDYTVLVGARDETKGAEAVEKLKSEGFDADFIEIDATKTETIKSAVEKVGEKYGKLDVLVNNAGIALDSTEKASEVSGDLLRKTFDTNFFGVIAITQAFLPLIKKSEAGRIVNVSSGLGSLTQHSDPNWEFYNVKPLAYNSSKTALNAFTVTLAHELKNTNIKVNSADPGYTATDLNGNSGTKTVAEGASVITDLATLGDDGATGSYFDDQGKLPW
jgi:NAD(P)-dependent dehydrogenase (short-subunit alcohol dehydrogenase family)